MVRDMPIVCRNCEAILDLWKWLLQVSRDPLTKTVHPVRSEALDRAMEAYLQKHHPRVKVAVSRSILSTSHCVQDEAA